MHALLTFLVVIFVLSPAIAAGQSVTQDRTIPFGEFDLTVIGIALVAVLIVLGIRAAKRRRPARSASRRS